MNFAFSMDNYYLIGAIALAVLLIVVGAFMYFRNGVSTADMQDDEMGATAADVYREAMEEGPPMPEPASEMEHAHAE